MGRWLFLFLACSHFLEAQSPPPVLQWQTHFSYHSINHIAEGNGQVVYAAGENGILKIDLEESRLQRIDKNNDLNGVDIGAMAFHEATGSLWVAYRDGSMDWITEERVKNISDVLNFQTNQSKTFHDIQFYDGRVYLGSDLGVVVYDPVLEEIVSVFQNLGEGGSPLAVYGLQFNEDVLYLATSSGILSAPTRASLNLQDFNNWQRQLVGISFQHITLSEGQLWAASDGDIFRIGSDNEWKFQVHFNEDVRNFTQGSDQEPGYLVLPHEVRLLKDDFSLFTSSMQDQNFRTFLATQAFHFIGTEQQGLLQFNFMQNQVRQQWLPSGPSIPTMFHQQSLPSGSFWVKHTFDSLNHLSEEAVLSFFLQEDRTWQPMSLDFQGRTLSRVTRVVNKGSARNGFYIGSFDLGLFEKTSEGIISLMQLGGNAPAPNANNSFQLSGMALQNDQLWVTFYDRSQSVYSFDQVGRSWERHQLSHPVSRFLNDVFIAPNGDKWFSVDVAAGGGILVYHEASGRERYLNMNGGQGGLPGRKVQALATDRQGQVWIGMASGVAFLSHPNRILEGASITASIPIFESRLLLQNESVTAIAIDPANRKWLGSKQNGLWLFSETGEELIFHFTTENSPLPSNRILSLGLQESTGELFVTTEKGMVSFRSDATLGGETHQNVKVYPNPVRPRFRGNVVIEGLVNNATLKITDVSGKLVITLQANGGTATWNQRDINGSRVSTGVYLLFSSNVDGTETLVTQIVVI